MLRTSSQVEEVVSERGKETILTDEVTLDLGIGGGGPGATFIRGQLLREELTAFLAALRRFTDQDILRLEAEGLKLTVRSEKKEQA